MQDPRILFRLKHQEYYHIELLFGMPYPKSKLRKDTDLSKIPHNVKPDLDNLIKFVLDCGNSLLWPDDKRVVRLVSEKIYSDEPKTIITIY